MDSNFQKIPAEEPDPAPFETKTRMACAKIETQNSCTQDIYRYIYIEMWDAT